MKNKYDLPSIFEVYALEQKRKKKSRKTILIIVAVIVGVWIIGVIALTSNDKKHPADQSDIKQPAYTYEIMKQDGDANTFQNYFILINSNDLSENTIKAIAFELKSKVCEGRCNITLYSNKDSYLMERKLEEAELDLTKQLSEGSISKEQNKKEYAKYEKKYFVKIADGLVGSIMIDSDDFTYYPLQDWHYKELGGANAHKKTDIEQRKINTESETTDSISVIGKVVSDGVQLNNAEREQKIKHVFSAWDGSAIKLVSSVKSNMNDPDSFEHLETKYSDKGSYLVVVMKYRGKNAYGAKVINYIKAKIDLDGNIIEIIDNE